MKTFAGRKSSCTQRLSNIWPTMSCITACMCVCTHVIGGGGVSASKTHTYRCGVYVNFPLTDQLTERNSLEKSRPRWYSYMYKLANCTGCVSANTTYVCTASPALRWQGTEARPSPFHSTDPGMERVWLARLGLIHMH